MRLDFSKLLYIDFEAQSELDIREVGAFTYAEHKSTVPLCAAWAIGDGDIQLWVEGEPVPPEWATWNIMEGHWYVAHNHDTEQQLLLHKFGIKTEDWIDTASLASCAGLPRALWDVSRALHLDEEKHRQYVSDSVMLQLARPRKVSADNPDRFWRPETRADLFEQLYAYCKNDVSVMRTILGALPPYHWIVTDKERALETLTNSMNSVGVKVDLHAVGLAALEVERHTEEMTAEFMAITDGIKPRANIKAAQWFGLDSVDKESLRDALKTEPEGPRRRAMILKKTLNTAAVSKLRAFANRTSRDGRLHGAMVYCGAGRTWRWSSMGVQLHNLIRGLGSGSVDWEAVDTNDDATAIAFDALHGGVLSSLYPNPTRAVASMMKGFLTGPFYIGDFSQIEPRVLSKLAGQTSMLDAFRLKKDPYKALAAYMYQVAFEAVTKDQRFMGKQGVLGCGYGLGRHGFMNMLKTIYDIEVDEEEAQRVVSAYRDMNPNIVGFWYDLERLVKQAVLEQWQEFHTSPRCPGIAARMYKSWLCIRLPSGRVLWYFEPSLVPGDRGFELHYWGRNPKFGGQWMRVKTYGGKLAENVTQAIARDIMAEAMLRLQKAGFQVLLTVHDEIVCQVGPNSIDLELFEHIMKQEPDWFKGIPLDVDTQRAERYQK